MSDKTQTLEYLESVNYFDTVKDDAHQDERSARARSRLNEGLGKLRTTWYGNCYISSGLFHETNQYEIVESGADYVVIQSQKHIDGQKPVFTNRLRLEFVSDGYWVAPLSVSYPSAYKEKFKRLKSHAN